METLRGISVTIEIDTNKATYRETFDSMSAAVEWWNDRGEEFTGYWFDKIETPEEFRKGD